MNSIIEQCTSPNGVFGTKAMWNYFPDFISKLRDIPRYREQPTPSLLTTLFPNLYYIFVTRRDKLGQAISLWKGLLTWTWRAEETADGGKKAPHELIFHFDAIDHLVRQLELYEQGWQRFFADHQIRPFTIVFEDLIHSKEATAHEVFRFLHIPDPPHVILTPPHMRRQADELSAAWIQQYHAIKQTL